MNPVLHVVVWGGYIRKFQHYLLASLLAGEPAGLLRRVDLEITTDDPLIGLADQLKSFASVKIVPLPLDFGAVHNRVALAERAFVARSKGRTMIFLCPDMVCASGAISTALDRLNGKMGLMASVIRANEAGPPIGADPRTLTRWAWANRHPFTFRQTWGSIPSYIHGSCLFFPCEAGYVARSHHLHPLILVNDGREYKFRNTIDDDLVCDYNPDEIEVVMDTDEMAFVELSPPGRTMGCEQPRLLTQDQVRNWAKARAKPMHSYFFSHRVVHRLWPGGTAAADQQMFPSL